MKPVALASAPTGWWRFRSGSRGARRLGDWVATGPRGISLAAADLQFIQAWTTGLGMREPGRMHDHDLPTGTCPSCGHNEIIEANPRHVNADHPSTFVELSPPFALTYERTFERKIDPVRPLGVLWSYTCRQCGLTQWVVAKPTEVPVGPGHGTRLIAGPGTQGAYR